MRIIGTKIRQETVNLCRKDKYVCDKCSCTEKECLELLIEALKDAELGDEK